MFADSQIELAVNVNEAPSSLVSSSSEILFEAQSQSVVALISTNDSDIGDIFKYSFPSSVDSFVVNNFELQGDKLKLLTDARLLPQSELVVPIQVTDQSGLSYVQDLVFSVQPEPTYLEISNRSIPENTEIDNLISSISVLGPESDRDFTFSLVSNDNDSASTIFSIDGSHLQLLQPLNFEAQSSHSVVIRAEDEHGFVLESTFVFDVIDENEIPTDFPVSTSSIPENLPSRSTVSLFSQQILMLMIT